MEIDNFSGMLGPGSPYNVDSVNRPDSAKFARIPTKVGSGEHAETKESASVKVSIASHRPRVDAFNYKVVFDVDPESKDVVIKLFNESTGEEIRQIPAEDVLRLSQRINEFQEKILDLG